MEKDKGTVIHSGYDTKLAKKIFDITNAISVEKEKEGYNFTYTDPKEINKAVVNMCKQHKVRHYMNNIGAPVVIQQESGKKTELVFYGMVQHVLQDVETGYFESHYLWASGAGAAGQANGSMQTYTQRQFFQTIFKIGTEREEDERVTYSLNIEGKAVEKINAESFKDLMKEISTYVNEDKYKDFVGDVLVKLNKNLKSDREPYAKLSGIPLEYLEDARKTIAEVGADYSKD